jgi:hypothetical protein
VAAVRLELRRAEPIEEQMRVLRSCLFAAAVAAMIAGASGWLSPLLSTALWMSSALALACHPSSPIRRAAERGLKFADDPSLAPEGETDGRVAPERQVVQSRAA